MACRESEVEVCDGTDRLVLKPSFDVCSYAIEVED